jgi:hypothetical protein
MPLLLPPPLLLLQVLEYLWLLNSHHEWVYKHMHGDKDTFLLAFAMAGRLGDFKQVRLQFAASFAVHGWCTRLFLVAAFSQREHGDYISHISELSCSNRSLAI